MGSLKRRSIIGFILGLTMILSFAPLGALTSKVYAATTIDRFEVNSTTTSVEAGVLTEFVATTTTEHATIDAYGGYTRWLKWEDGGSYWAGFGYDTEAAFNDGTTHYGLRLSVDLDSGYQFSATDTKIYFNGEDVTTKGHTEIDILSWGGYVIIDLGCATGENPITHKVTFNTNGGTSIDSRTIVDGCVTSKPNNPSKTDYKFEGWYTDNTYAIEFDFSSAITVDTTIYAKWSEALILNEIRIYSDTTSVKAGALSSYTATTTTEHATIEAYGANTTWVKWKYGDSTWSGFGADYEMAVNDGKTHYGLRMRVNLSDDYQFGSSTKVYFNDVEVTTAEHTIIGIVPSFGGYVIIDLGLATGDFVTATSYEELKAAVDGCDGSDGTDLATNHVKLGADITVPASDYLRMNVITDFILDLNGYTLDVTNDDASMSICYGSNRLEQFTSGSLTITDTSASQTGTINVGYKPIFVDQYNTSNTGMHYKLTIDGGRFHGKSGANNVIFEFHTDNEYYWKDKSIIFDFKITKGYFEHVSTNMPAIVFANDSKLNNVTFNLSFDNLTFKAGAARLMTSNETYTMNDVVPEDTNFYIFNSSEDKQILITERTMNATIEVPSSLWYNIDGYTDLNYYGIKLVKQDGFNVTAPTFDNVEYGYSSVSAKSISIYNKGTSDLQVKSVAVDDTSKFMVTGSTQPTITSKATDDTSFTIQPVDGLEVGTHTATITVTDMADNTYTATVTLNVSVKKLPDLGIDVASSIPYGEEYTPTITGAPELGVGDYEFKYAKKVGESYQDVDDKPTSIGSYKVTINVTNRNYSASSVSIFYDIVAKKITPTVDTIADQTYTGSEIKPTVVVKDGSTTLTEGVDYEVTYSDNINVGTATATISEVINGNYTFSDKDANFTIIKKQLEKVTLRADEFEYTGRFRYPEKEVDNYNSSLLELSGTLEAVNIGDYTTTVSLRDSANYEWVDGTTGNLTLNWKIIHATITDASVTLPQTTYKVTGSEITPEPKVVLNRTLTKYTDYTVSYTNNINIGTATVTVTGKNNYTGTVNKNFTIIPKDSQTITFTNSTVNKTYGDSNFTITANHTVGTGTVTYSSSDTDVAEVNSTTGLVTIKKAGTTTITATANENADYAEGTASYDLTVDKKEISYTATVKDKTYNGNVTAEVENVSFTGLLETETLTKDTDYTVSATFVDSNVETNKNVNVTLTLKEATKAANYKLTDTSYVATASITGKEIQDTDVTLGTTTYTYDGIAKEPSVTVIVDGNTLTKGTDYEVVYTNNLNAGTATAKITAKEGSNYTMDGEVTKDFTINPMTITPTIADIAAVVYNGSEQTPTLTVTGDSKTLVKDIDYTVAYENNIYAGTAVAKITAKVGSNYTWPGTVDEEFTINAINSTLSGYPSDVIDSTNTTAKVVIGQTLDISTFVTLDPSEYQSEITFTITDAGLTGASLDTDGKTLKGVATEGTVTIKALFTGKELDGDSNLEYSSADLTFYVKVVDKEVVTISGLTDNQEITYTGNPVSLIGTITVSDDKVPVNELEVSYHGTGATDYDSTTAPTDVGTYTVTYRVSASNANYKGSVTYAFTIKKVELTKPTLSGTYTYNGNEQTATLENFDATTMNVANNTRTEAGSQDITVSLKDTANYTWADGTTTDVIIPFEIAKATPTIAIDNLSQKEDSVTVVTYTVTPATTDGTVKVEYKVSTADDTTYTETLPTTKETYTVRVTVTGDSNLEDTQNTATLTITRKTSSSGGGGSSATTKYTITVKQNSNGKISPETVKVEKGNDQKFEIKANDGYEIEDVKVDGKSVGAVKEYTFENVKATHTIEATFKKVEEVVPVEPEDGWKNPFVDVSEEDWYYEAVKFANENKLFNGVSENEFGANVKMTRGMLVTVLYRLAGEPATNKSIPFADVDTAMYYANPISWAKQNGIVNGIDENNFAPNEEISRQQLVTILYRFAKLTGKDVSVGEDTNILSYDDVNQVAEYAIPAIQWACGAGVITGRTESTLAPIGNATRAEVATMLMRFVNNK